jgi:hypothetical protein
MSILSELNTLLSNVPIPVETGVFSGVPPDEYCVLTPMTEDFTLFADNLPMVDISEVRISLFSKGNYLKRKRQIVRALLAADFTITARRYIAHEDDTGYHHLAIDVQKYYPMEEDS